jgi:hypothetical protein
MIIAVYAKGHTPLTEAMIPPGFTLRSFIDIPKEFVSSLTGIPPEMLDDKEVLNSYLGDEWSYIREERFTGADGVTKKPVKYYNSPKIILAKIYELGREIHSNTWINALTRTYYNNSKWIVYVTYPNEFTALKDMGAKSIFFDIQGRGMLDSSKSLFDTVVRSQDDLIKTINNLAK